MKICLSAPILLLLFAGCSASPSRPPTSVWEQARDRGVSFRAIGQEPGWLIEIQSPSRIHVQADYGQIRIDMPYAEPRRDPGTGVEVYLSRTDEHSLVVRILPVPCTDTMSGEPFETTVEMTLDERTLQGCGRRLS